MVNLGPATSLSHERLDPCHKPVKLLRDTQRRHLQVLCANKLPHDRGMWIERVKQVL